MMVNAWTGERHAYAILCLHLLVLMYHLRILFWWYDINCRCAASQIVSLHCRPAHLCSMPLLYKGITSMSSCRMHAA
jgi:hypothetical protein